MCLKCTEMIPFSYTELNTTSPCHRGCDWKQKDKDKMLPLLNSTANPLVQSQSQHLLASGRIYLQWTKITYLFCEGNVRFVLVTPSETGAKSQDSLHVTERSDTPSWNTLQHQQSKIYMWNCFYVSFLCTPIWHCSEVLLKEKNELEMIGVQWVST
jgi:hypothetical protein